MVTKLCYDWVGTMHKTAIEHTRETCRRCVVAMDESGCKLACQWLKVVVCWLVSD